MTKFLCFRPTRNIHESGFRVIEYGYLTYDESNKEVIKVVGRYDTVCSFWKEPIPYHLDLTKSGWFRILPRIEANLEWSYGGTIQKVGEQL